MTLLADAGAAGGMLGFMRDIDIVACGFEMAKPIAPSPPIIDAHNEEDMAALDTFSLRAAKNADASWRRAVLFHACGHIQAGALPPSCTG